MRADGAGPGAGPMRAAAATEAAATAAALGRHVRSLNPLPTLAAAAIAYAAAWLTGALCAGALALLVPGSGAGADGGGVLAGVLGWFGLPSPGEVLAAISWRAPFQLIAMAGGGTLRLKSLDDPPVVLELAAVPLPVLAALAIAAFVGGRESQKRWHGGLLAPDDARSRAAVAGAVVASSLLAGLLLGAIAALLAFFTAARIPVGDQFPPRLHAGDLDAAMGLTTLTTIALAWGRLSAPRLGTGPAVRLRALAPMALAVPLLLALIGLRGRLEATGDLARLLGSLVGEHRLGLTVLGWPLWALGVGLLAALVALASAPRPAGRIREPGEAVVLPLGCVILAALIVQVTRSSLVIQAGTGGFLGFGAREAHVAWEGSMSLLAPLAALALGLVVSGVRALRERTARS